MASTTNLVIITETLAGDKKVTLPYVDGDMTSNQVKAFAKALVDNADVLAYPPTKVKSAELTVISKTGISVE